MRVVVVINRIAELTERQTTWMLIAELARRDIDLFVAEVGGLKPALPGLHAVAKHVAKQGETPSSLADAPAATVQVEPTDLVLLRTNPGRDSDRSTVHDELLTTLQAAEAAGTRVMNRPAHLKRMAAKTSLFELDERFRPPGLVSNDADELFGFIRTSQADCIVKPVVGSRGRDVLRISKDLTATEQTEIRELLSREAVICQHFVAWDQPGDIRLVVFNGEPLSVDGRVAAIHRVPADNDFRGNLHAGGTAKPIDLTEGMINAATHAARHLNRLGISLAGIDLVSDQIIEMNVYSTGGLFDATRFYERDFVGRIIDGWLGQRAN